MRTTIVVALIAGIFIGLALPYLASRGEAQAQPEAKKTQWEYKTVNYNITVGPPPNPGNLPVPDPTGSLNPAGAEGWETTGIVLTSERPAGGNQQQKTYSFVLKRVKEK